jgi:hypothetical protein
LRNPVPDDGSDDLERFEVVTDSPVLLAENAGRYEEGLASL